MRVAISCGPASPAVPAAPPFTGAETTSTVNLDLIRTDGGTQPRAGLDSETVCEYKSALTEGAVFPPLIVFYDGACFWLADGFHRYEASKEAGATEVVCHIRQGTQHDARWFAFGANKTHGLRRSNADKQRAVRAALQHPLSAGMSDSAIGRHVGVDHKTVAAQRAILGISQDTRTVTRGGTTYQQSTANIGKTKNTPSSGFLDFLREDRTPEQMARYEDNLLSGRFVPPAGHALVAFQSPNRMLWINASSQPGYYFVTTLDISGTDGSPDGFAEGTVRPIRADAIEWSLAARNNWDPDFDQDGVMEWYPVPFPADDTNPWLNRSATNPWLESAREGA